MDLDLLDQRYRVILCDIWGVVHDGVRLYPGVAVRLTKWRAEGRLVILITNAPRTGEAVEHQLARIGLPAECWHAVITAGEAGILALTSPPRPVGFLGTSDDRATLEGRGVVIAAGDAFAELACLGLDEDRDHAEDYDFDLERWAARDVLMHCLNPDRVVIHDGIVEACAGALADRYQALGGRVFWYGKPHAAIYQRALSAAGDPPLESVLAIGDGLATDMLGAARFGIDCIFVAGGIHGGEPIPDDFAREHGLGEWRPVGIVDRLG